MFLLRSDRTLVAMTFYNFHVLIMEKWEFTIFLSQLGYLDFFDRKCLLSSPLRCIRLSSESLNMIGCGINFRK